MKRIAMLMVFALAASLSFAQMRLSAGGGALFEFGRGGGAHNGAWREPGGATAMRKTGFGAFAFLDVSFAELAVSLAFDDGSFRGPDINEPGTAGRLSFTLLGKVPLRLGRLALFPLFGVSYNMTLSSSGRGSAPSVTPNDVNRFGILGGAGLDFALGEHLFIRGEALCRLRFINAFNKGGADYIAAAMGRRSGAAPDMGPVIRTGVGWKF